MKKKAIISIFIILTLLLCIVGGFYFLHPKDDKILLAAGKIENQIEDDIETLKNESIPNEIIPETNTVIPDGETEVKEEIPKQEKDEVEKTTNKTSTTSSNTTKETSSNNKNNQKNTKNTSSKSTTTTTDVQNSKSVQTSTKSAEKTEPSQPVAQSTTQPKRCTNNSNHGMDVGNCGKWFNSKNEAISFYEEKIKYWDAWWKKADPNDTEADATYYKNCPTGYEIWSCIYCGKWTINLYYR